MAKKHTGKKQKKQKPKRKPVHKLKHKPAPKNHPQSHKDYAPAPHAAPPMAQQQAELLKNMPPEAKKKLEEIKAKLDKLKEKLLSKFENYIIGISLMPPQKEQKDKNQINVLVLVDDTDSQKMSKAELKDKLTKIILSLAKEVDKNIAPETIILTELWQTLYDAKYELLQTIAVSAPIYDKGMLAALKVCEIHKSMVLKKFEKYIVSYVLAGSLPQGRATAKSDIDVFIVIDDTDVKKMTRAELKDKLRAIIIGMGFDAGKMTGVENKLNIQVYILTDFWDNIKEANPVIFTFLRDGVPLYDRGIFMPWKQLLKMGKVKPSPEAIDMFMHTGDQMLQRISFKLREIGMEDTFYAILTPSQAALMLYGIPPPTPKETPEVMREIFVKKEKLLEEEYVKILEKNIQVRKELEHGEKKDISGQELDELITNANKYLKRLTKLFAGIEKLKENELVLHAYENVITVVRDILRMEGHLEQFDELTVQNLFEHEIVKKGKVPEKFLRMFKQMFKAKADYASGKLTKTESKNAQKISRELVKFLIEHIQRVKARELERAKIRVKHGSHFGEVILLGHEAFIIHDIDNEQKGISKAKVAEDGSLAELKRTDLGEFEKALVKVHAAPKIFIKEKLFENLKSIFGNDVEIMLNY